MKKVINSNEIAGNAFITMNKKTISIEDLYEFTRIMKEKTKKDKEVFISSFDIESFTYIYSHILTKSEDGLFISINDECNNAEFLNNIFRSRIPKRLNKVFTETALEMISDKEDKQKRKLLVK